MDLFDWPADMDPEPYIWSPSNSADVAAAYAAASSAVAATLELSDDPDTDFADPATVPATPVAPTVTGLTTTSIRAVAVAPDDGGESITSYDWRYKVESEGATTWIDRLGETDLTQDFTGLDPSTAYEVQVLATNSVGDSARSPSGNANTENADPTVEITTQDQTIDSGADLVLSATATDLGAGSIASVLWTGSGTFSNSAITGPTWTAPTPSAETEYVLTLTATDNQGAQGVDTVTITVREPAAAELALSDFDDTGLDVVALALVTTGAAESTGTVYRTAGNGGPLGSISTDSDLLLTGSQSVTRIGLNFNNVDGVIRLWDQPSGEHLGDFFNTDNPNLTVRIQFPDSGPFELTRRPLAGATFRPGPRRPPAQSWAWIPRAPTPGASSSSPLRSLPRSVSRTSTSHSKRNLVTRRSRSTPPQ